MDSDAMIPLAEAQKVRFAIFLLYFDAKCALKLNC